MGVSVVEGYTLNVGSRRILVEPTPLLVAKSNFRTQSLRWTSDQLLVLKPSAGSRGFALIFILFGAFLVLTAVTIAASGQEPLGKALIGACGGVVFLAIGMMLWILPLRFEFDAAAGQLRTSRLGGRWQRPLRDVLAVQLIEVPRSR